jgi:hypothetical protein
VSHTDDVARAATGDNRAWSAPVPVTRQSPTTQSDKEAVWSDEAASSPYFGRVHECDDGVLSNNPKTPPQPVMFSRSVDGGATWEQRQVSSASDPVYRKARLGDRSGCQIDMIGDQQSALGTLVKGTKSAWIVTCNHAPDDKATLADCKQVLAGWKFDAAAP